MKEREKAANEEEKVQWKAEIKKKKDKEEEMEESKLATKTKK